MFKICEHPAVASRLLLYKQCRPSRNVVVPRNRWISGHNDKPVVVASLLDRHHHGCSFSSSSRPLPPPGPPPGPPRLFDFAIQRNFKKVQERVQTHPYEASYRHPRRWTALHCVVEYGAPIDVIKAVYEAYPEALHATDYQGRTPHEVALMEDAKQFLKEQAALLSTKTATTTTTLPNQSTLSNVGITETSVRTLSEKEIQRIILHTETLSEQVSKVTATCLQLQSEVDELKQRLTKLT